MGGLLEIEFLIPGLWCVTEISNPSLQFQQGIHNSALIFLYILLKITSQSFDFNDVFNDVF